MYLSDHEHRQQSNVVHRPGMNDRHTTKQKKRAGSYEHNWLACASMYLVAKLVPFNICFCLFLRTLKHLASMVNAFDNVKTKKSEGWRWFLFLVSQSHYVVATSVCQSTRNQLSICLTTKGREREIDRKRSRAQGKTRDCPMVNGRVGLR